MTHGQVLKNLTDVVEIASEELSNDIVVDIIIRAESALKAAINLKRYREKVDKKRPIVNLDSKLLYSYFMNEYPKMFGKIKKEPYWLKVAEQLADKLVVCINPDKGILIYGGTGVGKTTMMQCYAYILNSIEQEIYPSFITVTAKNISESVKNDATYALNKFTSPVNEGRFKNAGWFYDDVGTEDDINYFGNKSNSLKDLLQLVYNKKSMWGKIHMSTNLTENDMENRYGERILSRINEMFTVIRFPANAKDMRL